jgi:hypothetical protein
VIADGPNQKVTNITNIIYNFNYGTPQAQATHQQNGTQSLIPKHTDSPTASLQKNTNLVSSSQSSSQLKKKHPSLNNEEPIISRKIKVDPALHIKVNGNEKSKNNSPKYDDSIDDEEGNALSNGHKKRPNTGSSTNQQFRQSFKRNAHVQNPGSAAVL